MFVRLSFVQRGLSPPVRCFSDKSVIFIQNNLVNYRLTVEISMKLDALLRCYSPLQ